MSKEQLDIIVQSFNEKWFQNWEVTPEDQREKFISLTKFIQAHPNFKSKYLNNPDEQNKSIAFEKL